MEMEAITINVPVLALRGLTVFPHMNLTLDVERRASILALERAMEAEQEIFLVTQREVSVEAPEEKDLYAIGTVSRIRQILRLSAGSVRCVVEGRQRALRIGSGILCLQPVGEEEADVPFAVWIAAPEQVPGPAPGVEQIRHCRLLPGGEEWGMGGDAPALGLVQLVQRPAQQDPLLPVPGTAVQQLFLVHRGPPSSISG